MFQIIASNCDLINDYLYFSNLANTFYKIKNSVFFFRVRYNFTANIKP
jgi:hypothetical protein